METIKTSTKGKEIHISCKANLVNKAKDVKSNFKALELQISRVKNIEFSNKRTRRRVDKREKDQATKGLRRMPWYMAPKKDVTSCEKLRGGANIQRSADIRMRELSTSNNVLSYTE